EREAENTLLPEDFKSGTDLSSKLLLNDPLIINVITKSLLQKRVNNLYISAQNEWCDGSKSDILYVPKSAAANASPPILIEIQNRLDQTFLCRLIKYSTHVADRY
ncbi:uncharacterized protein EV154DRAFT_399403, partial [Mucor mucedo]|uniref:uncharacterized protein n=1 Tax=Mucor mucedo TaxID=29922 RepID=UPI00222095C4